MKKIISLIMICCIAFSATACSKSNIKTVTTTRISDTYVEAYEDIFVLKDAECDFTETQLVDIYDYMGDIKSITDSAVYILMDKENVSDENNNEAEQFFNEARSFISQKDVVISVKKDKVNYFIGPENKIETQELVDKFNITVGEHIWTTENAYEEVVVGILKKYAEYALKDYMGGIIPAYHNNNINTSFA